jgi:signal transduction histidine kinase
MIRALVRGRKATHGAQAAVGATRIVPERTGTGGVSIAQPAQSALSARRRLQQVEAGGRSLLVVAAVTLAIATVAHLAAASRLIGGDVDQVQRALLWSDATLALVLLLAVAWYVRRLVRERRRHALVEVLVDALSVPASIESTAEVALETLLGAQVASAGILGVISGDDDASELTPLAVAGARRGWSAEAGKSPRLAPEPEMRREPITGDPWLLGLEVTVGRTPWVARIPIVRGDEALGQLLLASPDRGWLRDRALLYTIGTILAAALDHGRQYQVAFERTRDLEEQNARRREFLYAIAHELRSPLTSIQAFAELLDSDRSLLNGDHELLMSSLARGVDRLATFVNDLLDLGRVESGLRVQVSTIDVSEALRGVETMLRPAFMAREQALTIDLPEDALRAQGDERALEQVMLNLLSNANRFTPSRGAVTVRAALTEGRVRIEVHDSGPGIDALDRQRIFEPFYRVQRAGAPEVPGSGLGLAVARRLTELQGGRIWVEGTPGSGSCFFVELPGAMLAAEAAPEPLDAPAV